MVSVSLPEPPLVTMSNPVFTFRVSEVGFPDQGSVPEYPQFLVADQPALQLISAVGCGAVTV